MKLKLSLLSVSLIALMSTGNIFGMEFRNDGNCESGESSGHSEKSASAVDGFGVMEEVSEAENRENYDYSRNIRMSESILNTKININKGQTDKRNSYDSFNSHDSSNENRPVRIRNSKLKNNLRPNKIDKAVGKVNEENGQSTDTLLENINKKISANARVKADDVCKSRNIDIIIDDGELCNYWAYDAIKNPNSRFYRSMQNLKTIILKGVRLSDNDYEIFLESIARNIGKHLFPENVTKSVDSDVVLSLYNGFLCSHAVRNCITLEQHGKQINPSGMYIEALQALDSLYVGLGYDVDTIHQLIEGIIKDRTSNVSASYDNYFKHDFDCYLNQFWVLTDGETADGDKVKSVVSALVTVDSPTYKDKVPMLRNENEDPKQITEEEKVVNEGRNVLDTLELKIGCKLKDLVDNPDLAELESILKEAKASCPVSDTYCNTCKNIQHLKSSDTRNAWPATKRVDGDLNEQGDREYVVDEGLLKNGGVIPTIQQWQTWIQSNGIIVREYDGDNHYFYRDGNNANYDVFLKLGEFEKEAKERNRIIIDRLEKQRRNMSYSEKPSEVINELLYKNPRYSYEIWRIFQVVCMLYGFDPDDKNENTLKESEQFWHWCLKGRGGSQALNHIEVLWGQYPTIFEVVSRMLVLLQYDELVNMVKAAGTVLDNPAGEGSANYAFGLLMKKMGFCDEHRYQSTDESCLVIDGSKKCVKNIDEKINTLAVSGIKCNLLNKMTSVFTAVLVGRKNSKQTNFTKELQTGEHVSRTDSSGNVRYDCPLLTAAISVFIRQQSYYFTYFNDVFTALREAYTAYRMYSEMKGQSPDITSEFLTKMESLSRIKKLFNKEKFAEICKNTDVDKGDMYLVDSQGMEETLKEVRDKYKTKCQNNLADTIINLHKKDETNPNNNSTSTNIFGLGNNFSPVDKNQVSTSTQPKRNEVIYGPIPDAIKNRNRESSTTLPSSQQQEKTKKGPTIYGKLPSAVINHRLKNNRRRGNNSKNSNNNDNNGSEGFGTTNNYSSPYYN